MTSSADPSGRYTIIEPVAPGHDAVYTRDAFTGTVTKLFPHPGVIAASNAPCWAHNPLGDTPDGNVKNDGPVTLPPGVATDTGPAAKPGGTSTLNDVSDAETTGACRSPIHTVLRNGTGSNPEPVIVNVDNGDPEVADNDAIVGAGASTVNDPDHDDESAPTDTETCPAPPAGTVTSKVFSVDAVTVAPTPPKLTAFADAEVENPVPDRRTVAPARADAGTTAITPNADES